MYLKSGRILSLVACGKGEVMMSNSLRRRLSSAISAAAVALAVALGAGGTAARADNADRFLGTVDQVVKDKDPPIRYGVTLVHLQDDYWKGMAYGIVDEVQKSGGKVVQVSIAGKYGNVAEQFAQIDAMMTKGIDVLVLGAASYDGFDPILTKAKEKGIKILAVGTPVNSKIPDWGVLFSDFDIGNKMGTLLCEKRPADRFTIIGLPGPAGAEWTKLRVDGLKKAIDACPGATLQLAPVGGEISIGYALSQTSDMITKYPDANFVWTPTMGLGMGAVQAIKQRNANMKVVGSTIMRGVFQPLEEGTLLAVNAEPSILVGRLIVQYLIRQKLGMSTPLIKQDADFKYPIIIMPTQFLTKDNYKTYPWEQTDVPPKDWSIDAFQ
jgi:ABC-type sugar transport system substrate-binding protein